MSRAGSLCFASCSNDSPLSRMTCSSSANDQERYASFGARVVPDLHPQVGALGGIQAAISGPQQEHCLVVACDMPFLSLPLLRRMAHEPRNYDVLVPLIPGREPPEGRWFGVPDAPRDL